MTLHQKLPFEDPVIINHNSQKGQVLLALIDPDTQFGIFGEGISYNRDCFEIPEIQALIPDTLAIQNKDVLIPNKLLQEFVLLFAAH